MNEKDLEELGKLYLENLQDFEPTNPDYDAYSEKRNFELKKIQHNIERLIKGTINLYKTQVAFAKTKPNDQTPMNKLNSLLNHLREQLNGYSQFTDESGRIYEEAGFNPDGSPKEKEPDAPQPTQQEDTTSGSSQRKYFGSAFK